MKMKQILIVDDKEENLYLLRALLEGHGYEVVAAIHGADALKKARQNPPDLIVTDILMPVMDGFALCREWKKDARLKRIPLIFYTATYTDERDRQFALSLGAERFIVKPTEPDTFMAVVRETIRQVASSHAVPAKRAGGVPARLPIKAPAEESVYLKQYNEVLIRKLEAKTEQLERTNHELEQDMTERKRGEAELRQANSLLKNTFEAISDLLTVHNRDLRVVFSNWHGRDYVTEEERRSTPYCYVCYMHRDQPCESCPTLEVFSTGRAVTTEVVNPHTGKITEVSAYPVFDDSGRVQLVTEHVRDITDRKRAEEALRESREKYRDLVESSNDWVWQVDANAVYTYVGPNCRELLGYEPEEIIGKTPFDLMPPEERQRVSQVFASIAARRAPFRGLENTNLHKDGHRVVLETNGTPVIDEKGVFRGYRGIDRDITERKRAEEGLSQLAAIVEFSDDAIIGKTLDGIIVSWNSGAQKLYGYSAEEAIGQSVAILVPPDRSNDVREILERIRRGERIANYECVRQSKDGQRIHVSLTISPITDSTGKIAGVSTIARDITERKKLEDQFRQAQKMESVGRLAGGIAHDFNNLLTIITGYGQLLLDRLDQPDPLRAWVEEIRKAGDRAAALTRQLLAFSRKQVLDPQVLDLNALVANMDQMLRRLVGEDVDLVTVQKPGLGHVMADAGQIEQIIMNLAVNARDAMPQGGKLTIETANVELDETYGRSHTPITPGPYVMLAVSDTGCGMDAETRGYIFEPFFTTKEKGKGTGLGLAMVYGTVKQSGGYIWVYSEPGKGTTFKIHLPRIDQPAKAVAAGRAEGAELPRGSETILLVEDEEAVRSFVKGVLESAGYQVLEAQGASDALKIGEQHRSTLHLLLTDVVMPEMGGRQLAERLTPLHPETKVLYMSGYTDDAIVRHGVLVEGVMFLQKPFTPDDLLWKVRESLDGRREDNS